MNPNIGAHALMWHDVAAVSNSTPPDVPPLLSGARRPRCLRGEGAAMSEDAYGIGPERSVLHIAEEYGAEIILLRWFGCWIDMVGCASCLLIPDWFLGNELYRKTVLVWLTLAVSYFLVPEWLWGRTLGKFITGTIVVDKKGHRPTLEQVLIRTVLRLVEVNPLVAGGAPAGVAAALSKRKQRLGDMAADTYVIRARDLEKHRTAGG